MYCSNCGKEIDNNAKFCQYCGSQIGQNNQQIEPQPTQTNNAMTTHYQQNLEKLKKKIQLNGLFLFDISNLTLNIANDGSNMVHIMGDITLKNGKDLNAQTEAVLTITKGLFNTTEKTYSLGNGCTFDFEISYDELLKAVSILITARPAKAAKVAETTLGQDSNTNIPQPNGCSTVIRNLFAIGFFVNCLVALSEPDMKMMLLPFLVLGLLMFTPSANKINQLLDKYPNKTAIKVWAVVLSFILCGIFAPKEPSNIQKQDENSAINSKQTIKIEKEQPKQIYKAPIADGAIWELPTQKGQGFDKTIAKYGVEGIKKINSLTPKVAEKISYNTTCDKVVNVDVSDNRSTRNNLVFYGDCANMQRFYLTEAEVLSPSPIKSEKEKLQKSRYEHEILCENAIKSQLNHPSTYKKLFTKSGSETKDLINDILIGFKAKNSLNLELEYTCRCFVNSRGNITRFDIQEKR